LKTHWYQEQPVPATFRERQRQVREEAILDAAFDLLRTKGYAAMTMEDVAAGVGVSKATLYQHFASKEDLTATVMARMIRGFADQLASLDPRLPAVERLTSLIRLIVQFRFEAEKSQETPSVGGLGASLRPIVAAHPRFQEQYDRLLTALCALIDQGKAEGDIRPDMPTRLLVQVLLALMRDFDYTECQSATDVTGATLATTIATIFTRGVAPGSKLQAPSPEPGHPAPPLVRGAGRARSQEPGARSQEPGA
jgi:AcrR family transcriptional regulator